MFATFCTSYYSLGQKNFSTSLKISFACPEYTVDVQCTSKLRTRKNVIFCQLLTTDVLMHDQVENLDK